MQSGVLSASLNSRPGTVLEIKVSEVQVVELNKWISTVRRISVTGIVCDLYLLKILGYES